MRLYVLVSFWMGMFSIVCSCVEMAASTWPKPQKPKTLGYTCGYALLMIAATVWAGILLWVQQ
jgi:hypothetical protein